MWLICVIWFSCALYVCWMVMSSWPPAPPLNNNPNPPSWICILCVIWFCLTTHDISIEKKKNKQTNLSRGPRGANKLIENVWHAFYKDPWEQWKIGKIEIFNWYLRNCTHFNEIHADISLYRIETFIFIQFYSTILYNFDLVFLCSLHSFRAHVPNSSILI